MAGLDTGLAANSKQMTPLSDYAEHRLLAARPYSTYVGDYYKIQSYRPLRVTLTLFNLPEHSGQVLRLRGLVIEQTA